MGTAITRWPVVDLRALLLTSLAVSPIYLWFFADSLYEAVDAGDPIVSIISDQLLYAFRLLMSVLSTVIMSLGLALIVRRRQGVRPFSFVLTSARSLRSRPRRSS